jgi:tetratricopeptide (TPR) repeat protein
MNNNITPEMLIRYLDNELTAEERLLVEKELTEPQLSGQLHKLQVAKQAFKQYALKLQVAEIHKEMMQQKGSLGPLNRPESSTAKPVAKLRWLRTAVRIAALIILLVVVAGIIQFSVLDNQRLYSSQYETFTLGTARSQAAMSPIEEAYRQNDMPLTVQRYKQASAVASTDHFIAGQAFLSLNDAPNAIAAFEKQLAVNSSVEFKPYQDDTEYYLALAYLRSGNVNKALPIFEKIHNQFSHAYHRAVSGWYIFKLQMLKRKS